MTTLKAFFIGLFIGQLAMLPYVYMWMKHPVVQAIPIPTEIFKQLPYRKYIMYGVPHRDGGKRDLTVIITSEENVHTLLNAYEGTGDYSGVLGFYNPKNHLIVTMDSVDLLVHEMRHAFEGAWHRGPQNDNIHD
jgi:hypothetical protein